MAYLNLASLRLCTESEGPGRRMAIWVQGCRRRCPGCCNPEMQEIRKNVIVDTADLINLIEKAVEEYNIEGLSFIGGEPVLQAQGLGEIAAWAKSHNLTVLLFSGYLYEELKDIQEENVKRLLEFTDILVDGPFIQELYDEERDWIGSGNQKAVFLSDAYPQGIEYEKHERSMEMLVSDNDILVNGWPFQSFL